jgi:hypothetical protein
MLVEDEHLAIRFEMKNIVDSFVGAVVGFGREEGFSGNPDFLFEAADSKGWLVRFPFFKKRIANIEVALVCK